MNKIICDVCGTDYPETAEQCPICGCANSGDQAAAGSDAPEGEDKAARSYVKGGRFSKKNVNKRLKAMGAQPSQSYEEPTPLPEPEYEDDNLDEDQEPEDEEQSSNLGLIIIVVILLLAIAAVSAYIAVSIFGWGGSKKPTVDNNPTTSTTAPTLEQLPEETGVACTDLALSDVDIYFDAKGGTCLLTATLAPENTTDVLSYTSTDESVVTVDPVTGLVTAVGNGEASIIVTCGDVVRDCPVKCEFTEATEEPTETTEPEETTQPVEDFVLKLDKKDFTLFKSGATCDIYSGELEASAITWTSDNEEVATIKDGIVTAVGNGRTRVYGEYNGTKLSCWVSCKLPEEATEPEGPTEEATEPEQTGDAYILKVNGRVSPYGDEENAEVSITVDESFQLTVEDDQGLRQSVTWKASKDGICSVEGRTVTGEKSGKVTLTATLGDQTFKCVIIVK